MNTHFPQSILSSIELKYLAAVPHQIISPAHSTPIIKPVQDTLLGFYKMTEPGVYFNKRDAMNLLGKVSTYTGQLPEPDVPDKEGQMRFWSGHSIVSVILPEINFYAVDDKNPNNINIVEIVRGQLLRGQIKKSQSGSILHIIYNDFGTKVATEYLDNLQSLITAFLVRTGFSVGPRDLIIPNNVRQTVKKVIAKGIEEVNEIQKQIHLGTFNDPSEPDNQTAYENKVRGITSKIESTVENIVLRTADKDNRILQAVTSGSKGSTFNYRQMVGIVGGQYINNKRIPFGFSDRTRSLPHYYRYDAGLEAKGFVTASFIEGLNPKEFFFHAMGGREGLIDTAVKTAESGYVQRRLIKAMEDLKVCYDYSVRNSTGDIYQTLYGEDGMNPAGLMENQKVSFLYYSHEKLAQDYRLQENENWDVFMHKKAITSMKKDKRWKKILDLSFEKLLDDRDYMINHVFQNKYITNIMAPVNIQRTIVNVARRFDLNKKAKSDLDPIKVIMETEKLIEKLNTHGTPNRILHTILRFNFAPKNLIFSERFTDDAFMYMISLVERQYIKTRISVSEMVGPIGAQSVGEISTQLTLNSIIGEEKLLIQEDGRNKVVEIGQWIDEKLKNNERRIKHIPENRTQYLELDEEVMIPSCDMDGNTKWCKLTAVTKHLPVGDLVKITTRSGRSVTATQSKSFLTYDETIKSLVTTNGADIKVGDRVPITYQLKNVEKATEYLDVSHYLPKKEWLYGTDYNKAKSEFQKYNSEKEAINKHNKGKKMDDPTRKKYKLNFKRAYNSGKLFQLPYNRYDSFLATLTPKKLNNTEIKEGIVYPKICQNVCSIIPEKIKLDRDFGFIVGLYLAEGWVTNTFMGISNNDEVIQQKVYDWCKSIGVTHHTVVTESKRFKNSKSTDIKIHSVILARLFKKWVNTGSSNKIVPPETYTAPDEFIKGLLDGYISGDGSVDKKDGSVKVSSVSENLILGVSNLMARFGIFGRLSSYQAKKNNIGSKNIKRTYILQVCNGFAQEFAQTICSTHPMKHERLLFNTLIKDYRLFGGRNYPHLRDVILDEVISIEKIGNCDEKGVFTNVYDVTVPETLNFTTYQNIGVKDTFHTAGTASAVTTGGVARLKELMACSKNIKTSSMKIYLDEDTKYDKLKALQVLKNLELTTIKDLLPEVSIYLDSNLDTNIPEDEALIDLYKTFNVINKEKTENPWVIRVKFNKQKMVEKNLTMFDVGFILQQNHSNISAIYTDDNADQLILRAKVDFEVDSDNIDKDMEKLVEVEKKIVNTIIKGVIDVSHVVMDKEKDNIAWDANSQSYQPKEEWVLTTIGTNLEDALLQDHVDPNRSYTNDINEVYNVLGVEAARNSIFKEFEEVIVKKGGSSLNYRHLGLLADYMTHKGFIMPIDRHGINRNPNVGPLAKSSFEETTDQLLRAGLFGDYDDLKGVSSNIIMGQMTKSGTGDSDLLLDEEMINATIKVKDVDEEDEEDGEQLFEKYLNVSDYCQDGVNIGFDIGNLEGDNVKLSDIPKIKPN